MKKQKVMSKSSKKHMFKGVFALVGLFACGFMLGLGLTDKADKPQVVNMAYAEPAQVQEPIKETCVVIEEILTERLDPEGSSYVYEYPRRNIEIYERLVKNGCPENVEKWKNAILREEQIIAALNENAATGQRQTCDMVEESLLATMPWADSHSDSDTRIERAKIYANLSERGCTENSEKYVALAKQELEIARALEDDEFDEQETTEVVETYKRLNMQMAAEEVFETVKKLTNPAIDFVLEIERIINEQ